MNNDEPKLPANFGKEPHIPDPCEKYREALARIKEIAKVNYEMLRQALETPSEWSLHNTAKLVMKKMWHIKAEIEKVERCQDKNPKS